MRYKLSFNLTFKEKEKLRKLLVDNNIEYGVFHNSRQINKNSQEFVNFFELNTLKIYTEEVNKGFEELF